MAFGQYFNTLVYSLPDRQLVHGSTADGRLVRQFPAVDTGDLAVSPTDDRFAIANARRIAVSRDDNGQLLYSFATNYWPPFVMQFSPDGHYLAAGYGMYYERGWWRLWRLSDGALVAGETYPFTSESEVWTLAFSHDSARLNLRFPYRTKVVHTHTGATVEEWHHPSNRVLACDSRQSLLRGRGQQLRGYILALPEHLDGWLGERPEHLRYTVRSAQTGEVLGSGPLGVVSRLGYSSFQALIPVPADIASQQKIISVEGKPFLRKSVLAMGLANIYLLTGDVDGDNEVTLFDFGQLVASFGSLAGKPDYNVWLVTNFGEIGDE